MLQIHLSSLDDRTIADFAIFVLAAVVLPFGSILSGRRIGKQTAISLTSRYSWLIVRGVAISLLVIAVWRMHDRPLAWLGLDLPIGPVGRVGLAVVGMLATAATIVVIRSHRAATPERIRRLRAQAMEMKILPRTNAELTLFIGVAAMAGILEELLYRGFMIWFLTPSTGVIGAIAFSTIVFAVGHLYQGRRGLLRAGGIGLAFAIWYVVTGSLWWLMALHALIDLFGGLMAWRLLRSASAGAEALTAR